ncbi:esterase/lipase family protein [Pyxidicoccus xibeiensis]|uniref:esterase/lipase family protein n=1 Tax=Pyxidicoccus xibeiensis TaxID=2906759 RepID=UPI0020A75F8C|nr:triacylglycerol lipase [Pyxidicoccus xibeiensis]MCP3136245.1 triacylglycerol lipase [Pyxidicoccus xibeiensis]
MSSFRSLCLAAVALCLVALPSSAADTYAKTRYPIVLAHGMAGFDSLFGVLDYFHGVQSTLASGGARVYVTRVPAFNATEARGEALLAQVEDIVARTGCGKVNLIGHSHGGLDVRYVAAVRPDLVASVTTVGSPHKGAALADHLRANLTAGGLGEGVLSFFANHLGTVLGLLSGRTRPQDAVKGLDALTGAGLARYNARFPAGVPATACGQGAATGMAGQRYYSWSGTGVVTNLLDVSDGALGLSSFFYREANDGLVGRCSSHFGTVLRDDYAMNHADEVNQVLGLTALFQTDPKSVYRAHANRLKNAGL